jgi:hypothetical protein
MTSTDTFEDSYLSFYVHLFFIRNMNTDCHMVIYAFILLYSAPPPPLQAATFSRGVVTMRCDISTCSSAHISLLVSGSPQACFNDQVPSKCLCTVFLLLKQTINAVRIPRIGFQMNSPKLDRIDKSNEYFIE